MITKPWKWLKPNSQHKANSKWPLGHLMITKPRQWITNIYHISLTPSFMSFDSRSGTFKVIDSLQTAILRPLIVIDFGSTTSKVTLYMMHFTKLPQGAVVVYIIFNLSGAIVFKINRLTVLPLMIILMRPNSQLSLNICPIFLYDPMVIITLRGA